MTSEVDNQYDEAYTLNQNPLVTNEGEPPFSFFNSLILCLPSLLPSLNFNIVLHHLAAQSIPMYSQCIGRFLLVEFESY